MVNLVVYLWRLIVQHHTPQTARTFHVHGVTFTSFVASATGSSSLAAWRADFPPRIHGQAHTMTHEEILCVLSGALAVEVGDRSFTASAGDAVLVPAEAVFRVSNDTDEPAQAWVTTTLGMTATMCDTGDALSPPWAQ